MIDASLVLGALLPDERQERAINMIAQSSGAILHAPVLWYVECANAALMAVRRGRLTMLDFEKAVDEVAQIPVQIDDHAKERVWRESTRLAVKYGLTVYDAVYLELSIRLGADLATLDSRLGNAAKVEGVELAVS